MELETAWKFLGKKKNHIFFRILVNLKSRMVSWKCVDVFHFHLYWFVELHVIKNIYFCVFVCSREQRQKEQCRGRRPARCGRRGPRKVPPSYGLEHQPALRQGTEGAASALFRRPLQWRHQEPDRVLRLRLSRRRCYGLEPITAQPSRWQQTFSGL